MTPTPINHSVSVGDIITNSRVGIEAHLYVLKMEEKNLAVVYDIKVSAVYRVYFIFTESLEFVTNEYIEDFTYFQVKEAAEKCYMEWIKKYEKI